MEDEGIRWLSVSFSLSFFFDKRIEICIIYCTNKLCSYCLPSYRWFWNPFNNDIAGWKTDFNGDPSFDFKATKADYDKLRKDYDGIQRKGLTNPNQRITDKAARYTPGKIALAASMAALKLTSGSVDDSPRDGYSYATEGTFFVDQMEGHLQCPKDCINDGFLFGLMDVTRRYALKVNKEESDKFPGVPLSIRLFTVARDDVFILNYLPKGRYIAIECTVPRGLDDREERLSKFLQGVEGVWNEYAKRASPSKLQYHVGKEWGFGRIDGLPNPYPFQSDVKAKMFFTQKQREKFLSIANMYDPNGVFRAGELARLLGVSDVKFDPRRGNREESQGASTSCSTFGDAECISGCCCEDAIWCWQGKDQCSSGRCKPFWDGLF